jgi:serpin B
VVLQPKEGVKQINTWVAESTKNLITEIIDPNNLNHLPDTVTELVLANAIYFKGKWKQRFNKKSTKDDKFYRLDGTTVDVPFMRQRRR